MIHETATEKGKIKTVILPDRMGFKDFRRFRAAYENKNEQLNKIILDASQINEIESFGLAMLIQMNNYFSDEKTNISIVNCNTGLHDLFSSLKLDQMFELEPSCDQVQ